MTKTALDPTKLSVVQKADCHCPSTPVPTPQEPEVCDSQFSGNLSGNLSGQLSGLLKMQCCCPQLRSKTFVIPVPPQQNPAFQAYLAASIAAWEGAGYLILAHHSIDVGGGWVLVFTVGWYA